VEFKVPGAGAGWRRSGFGRPCENWDVSACRESFMACSQVAYAGVPLGGRGGRWWSFSWASLSWDKSVPAGAAGAIVAPSCAAVSGVPRDGADAGFVGSSVGVRRARGR
jgi:hypothetical protein